MMAARQQPKPPGSQPGKVAGANRRRKAKEMDNNKKPSEPLEPERWALKEVNTMKNPLAVQILALSIQILALVVILLKK